MPLRSVDVDGLEVVMAKGERLSELDRRVLDSVRFERWLGDSQRVIKAYHGSPYRFKRFLLPDESGKRSGAYVVPGIHFSLTWVEAEPFSRQAPDWYYREREALEEEYKRRLAETYFSPTEDEMEYLNRELSRLLGRRVFVQSWRKPLNYRVMLEHLSEVERVVLPVRVRKLLRRFGYGDVRRADKVERWYQRALEELDESVPEGVVYTVFLRADEIVQRKGEDVGFTALRDEIVDNLSRGSVLYLELADTGAYLGDELVVSLPEDVFIV